MSNTYRWKTSNLINIDVLFLFSPNRRRNFYSRYIEIRGGGHRYVCRTD